MHGMDTFIFFMHYTSQPHEYNAEHKKFHTFTHVSVTSSMHAIATSINKACRCAGPLPVPEKWNEDLAKGAFNLEETDIGSSDQVHKKKDRQEILCSDMEHTKMHCSCHFHPRSSSGRTHASFWLELTCVGRCRECVCEGGGGRRITHIWYSFRTGICNRWGVKLGAGGV